MKHWVNNVRRVEQEVAKLKETTQCDEIKIKNPCLLSKLLAVNAGMITAVLDVEVSESQRYPGWVTQQQQEGVIHTTFCECIKR